MERQRWQDWVQLVLGIWLFFSPWILGFSGTGNASGNAYIIGIGLVVFAVIALYQPKLWEEWINLVLGVWLIIAPWVVGFSNMSRATENSVIIGILSVILMLWGMAVQGVGQRLVKR
jgi:hypothetical protein